jgi:3-phosphoshikimate 1-carboxyvinyltransferase
MKKLIVASAVGLKGTLEVPGDKSISHRAVMLGALAHGKTKINHFLASADCLSTIQIFRGMGVKIDQKGNSAVVHGKGLNSLRPSRKTFDAGNSGTTARIILGILAGQPFTSRLTGDKYLRRRPMRRVMDPLAQMGARFEEMGEPERLPLKIETRSLHGITYKLPIPSAQVKSCLLMAGLFADGPTTVEEPIPTRDHTERIFNSFGIPCSKWNHSVTVRGPVTPFKGRVLTIPGDISSAAFFIVAGLITPNSHIVLKNVGFNPTRTGLIEILEEMGARILVRPKKTAKGAEPVADLIIRTSNLKGMTVGGEVVPRMIDEFPVFAVAATQAKGITVVKDAEDLKAKESDRITLTALNLRAMGADIVARNDGWVIKGPTPLKGANVSSGGDHRIAMSLAVAGLIAEGKTTIRDTENIDTSFPGFEKALKKLRVR